MSKPINWSLFESQEKEIELINNELYSLRKEKYPKYLDSYYKHYKEFGFTAMIGDLYRKFDRLKNMSEVMDSKEDIISNKKEIKDQYHDLISYLQLQLYFMKNEYWNDVSEEYKIDALSGRRISKASGGISLGEISRGATGGYITPDAAGKVMHFPGGFVSPKIIKSEEDKDGITVLYFSSPLTPEQKEELKTLGGW